jgi:chromosome segregation ATPase
MKVKVSVKTSPKVQEKYYEQAIAEAYAEMETMIQENKDLRLEESHLKDELNILRQQSEARRQVICERDKLIQELNDQITASEVDVAYWQSKAEEATAELVKYDIGHYQREIDEWKATADKLSEQLRELQAVFADLQLEHQELGEDYDALVKTKCEYAEYIDTLRQENKRLRNQISLPEFMRQIIEMTRETVQNEFPDSGNS